MIFMYSPFSCRIKISYSKKLVSQFLQCSNSCNDVIEITAEGNNISTQVAYIRTCRFVDTTWHICFYDQLDKTCEM